MQTPSPKRITAVRNSLFALFFLVVFAPNASAQVSFTTSDSLPQKLEQLARESENQLFYDPKTPRFVMLDRSQNYLFGVGGLFMAMPLYDMSGNRSVVYKTSKIPIGDAENRPGRLAMELSRSILFFKMLGITKWGKMEMQIETHFFGASNTLQLRKAYIRFNRLLVGMDWSVVKDTDTPPMQIEVGGAPSLSATRLPTVQFTLHPHRTLQTTLALEIPTLYYNYKNERLELVQAIPDFNTKWVWRPTQSATIQLATILRYFRTDVVQGQELRDYEGFGGGALLSAALNVGRNTFYAQAVGGSAISDYINDLGSLDLVLVHDADRHLHPVTCVGTTLAYTRKWTKVNSTNLIFSYLTIGRPNEFVDPTLYRSSLYACLNYFHRLGPYFTVGAEVVASQKRIFTDETALGMRISGVLKMEF